MSAADRLLVEAAVDAHFTKQKHPVFRPGSAKWVGIRKYGFYVDLFFQIAIGDQAALAMSPVEWVDGWERHPHMMAILRVVQGRVRHHLAEESRRAEADMKAKGARHGRH